MKTVGTKRNHRIIGKVVKTKAFGYPFMGGLGYGLGYGMGMGLGYDLGMGMGMGMMNPFFW